MSKSTVIYTKIYTLIGPIIQDYVDSCFPVMGVIPWGLPKLQLCWLFPCYGGYSYLSIGKLANPLSCFPAMGVIPAITKFLRN